MILQNYNENVRSMYNFTGTDIIEGNIFSSNADLYNTAGIRPCAVMLVVVRLWS